MTNNLLVLNALRRAEVIISFGNYAVDAREQLTDILPGLEFLPA